MMADWVEVRDLKGNGLLIVLTKIAFSVLTRNARPCGNHDTIDSHLLQALHLDTFRASQMGIEASHRVVVTFS
jgi:hypothetical protein